MQSARPHLGLVPLPAAYLLVLVLLVPSYLVIVELVSAVLSLDQVQPVGAWGVRPASPRWGEL